MSQSTGDGHTPKHAPAAFSGSLLTTKLFVPAVRTKQVDRPRLIDKLKGGLDKALILISAPPGYGKTTLLSTWAASCGQPVAWLNLDQGDNDPIRFWRYIDAALQKLNHRVGDRIRPALYSMQPPVLQQIVIGFVNDIVASGRTFVLVLEDYHVIVNAEVHNGINFLLDNAPPNLRVIVTTRSDPPLHLALRRARGQVTEIRATDLRLSTEEATVFLNQIMQLGLAAEDIRVLERRTEGWIAGLHMAALSLRDEIDRHSFVSAFSGDDRHVADYLFDEVFQRQSTQIRDFLIRTSILERLNASLCDAVAERQDSQAILNTLERANVFLIPLDHTRCWYRYHHLFRSLLRRQLQQGNPDIIPKLHRRAGVWYEENHLVAEAIEHALKAHDYDQAATSISQVLADSLWKSGEAITILRWLESLPEELLSSRPDLCAFHALTLFLTGELKGAEARLQIADQILDSEPILDQHHRAEQKGMLAAVRTYIAFFQGDAAGIMQFARQALDLLPSESTMWRDSVAINLGDAYNIAGDLSGAQKMYSEVLGASQSSGNIFLGLLAGAKLAVSYKDQGQLRNAEEICRRLIQFATTREKPSLEIAGKLFGIWGEILCEWNELERAEAHIRKAVELCEREGNVATVGLSYLYLLRVLWAKHDLAAVEQTLFKLDELARSSNVPMWIPEALVAWKSWLWLRQGNLEAAEQILRTHGISPQSTPGYRQEGAYLSLARLLIAQGRPGETDCFLPQLYSQAESRGQIGLMIVCLCLSALAGARQGLKGKAVDFLEKALAFAEPEGYVQVFLEEGPPMARLLHEVATRGVTSWYAGKLITAFSGHIPQLDKHGALVNQLVQPLSAREIEVLKYMAEGKSNAEIASHLYLSPNTLRAHSHHIFGKLDVHNRLQAVNKAKELGLIE